MIWYAFQIDIYSQPFLHMLYSQYSSAYKRLLIITIFKRYSVSWEYHPEISFRYFILFILNNYETKVNIKHVFGFVSKNYVLLIWFVTIDPYNLTKISVYYPKNVFICCYFSLFIGNERPWYGRYADWSVSIYRNSLMQWLL